MSARPNVLVMLADQLQARACGLYGNTFCPTPSLDRLAADGVCYENAFTPHPLCVPARVSLWTGQYPHTHGSRRNQTLLRPGHPHAFRLWKEMGYCCGFIGKNHCFGEDADLELFDTWNEIDHLGIAEGAHHAGQPWARSIAAINDAHAVRRAMPRQSESVSYAATSFPLDGYGTSVVAEQTISFLRAQRDRPFALWVSFPDPHAPIEAPRSYVDRFPWDRVPMPPVRADEMDAAPERTRILRWMHGTAGTPEEHVRRQIAVYYAMARMVDDAVGRIMNSLDEQGLRERTIVVFCSDHGDFLGEHGIMDKGGGFYDCLSRVPLVVSWPGGVPAGRRDSGMASLVDIAPTLLRLQGIEPPGWMQGRPLPTATDAQPRDAAFAEYGAGGPLFTMDAARRMSRPFWDSLQWREAEGRRKMVRTAGWKYVHDPMGDHDELYALQRDPWELTNLAADPAYAAEAEAMRRRLLSWSIATEDAEPVPLPVCPG